MSALTSNYLNIRYIFLKKKPLLITSIGVEFSDNIIAGISIFNWVVWEEFSSSARVFACKVLPINPDVKIFYVTTLLFELIIVCDDAMNFSFVIAPH